MLTCINILCTPVIYWTEESPFWTVLYRHCPVLFTLHVFRAPILGAHFLVAILEPHTAGKPGWARCTAAVSRWTLVMAVITCTERYTSQVCT